MLLAGGWLALHWIAPDPAVRRAWVSLTALLLGYGHLLGASSPLGRSGSALDRLFVGLCAATALCAFTWAMQGIARLPVLALLGTIAGWHILENDRAMGTGVVVGRLPPLPRHLRPHAIALGGALLLVVIGIAAWGAVPPYAPARLAMPSAALEELAAALLLYHATTWILFVLARAQRLPRRAGRALRRRLLGVHALPVALMGAAWHWLPDLHLVLTSPALYLFWSGVHAARTAHARGLESA